MALVAMVQEDQRCDVPRLPRHVLAKHAWDGTGAVVRSVARKGEARSTWRHDQNNWLPRGPVPLQGRQVASRSWEAMMARLKEENMFL